MRKHNNGFTLIELMITVVVLAVLAAIATPYFKEILDRRKLNGAGEKLFADLMFAKTEAIKKNSPIRVTFKGSGATWCYGMAVDADCDCTDNAPACQIDGVTKIVNQSDYTGVVSVVATSSFVDDSTTFSPLRGAVDDDGKFIFSISSGAELGVAVSDFGRIRLCSDTGDFGHSGC